MSTFRAGCLSSFENKSNHSHFVLRALLAVLLGSNLLAVKASDWDEDSPKNSKTKAEQTVNTKERAETVSGKDGPANAASGKVEHPLEGKVEKAGEASLRIQRPGTDVRTLTPQLDGALNADDGLRGFARDGALKPMNPQTDAAGDPLQGKAVLLDGKGAKGADPDADDVELMVEWDRWHNRFLRAVQLGTQEILNNPDPEDIEHLRADPRSSNFTSRYPLGTGSAFSCIVTADGQIKSLEVIEASGFPKYDRAVLRAVQQLAGTQLLNFPKGSHRHTVIQPGRIKTATNSDFKYYRFGDVEHIRR